VRDQVAFDQFLRDHQLATPAEEATWHPLTGGVSSEIWRVDLPGRSICVKRALPQLKVADHWRVSVSRNAYEWQWLCFAARHQPQAVPQPLAHDVEAGLFAMSFLAPEQYPVWKSQLLQGSVVPEFAARVGSLLGQLHSASANRPDLASEFDSLENFHALRLEPYLLAAAQRHPDLASRLQTLVTNTAAVKQALVHGDVSPKNILAGPQGPVLLDAECAWYGDAAFDLAFCLNHLLLKSVARPEHAHVLLQSYGEFVESYFECAHFDARSRTEARAAALLPGLMLARIDGKSPVEYLQGHPLQQDLVRRVARLLLKDPVSSLAAISARWSGEIGALK